MAVRCIRGSFYKAKKNYMQLLHSEKNYMQLYILFDVLNTVYSEIIDD